MKLSMSNRPRVAAVASLLSLILVTEGRTESLALRGEFPDAGGDLIEEMTVLGNRAFLANGRAGLRIVDLTNPASPFLIGSVEFPGGLSRGVAVEGNLACLSDWWKGLHVVDVSNPSEPVHKASYAGRLFIDVAMSGSVVYVADYDSGVVIFDVAEPERPVVLSHVSMHRCNSLVLRGDHVFAADIARGLSIIDVTDPRNPFLAAQYSSRSLDVVEAVVSGDHAYIIGRGQLPERRGRITMLDVVDVGDPTRPVSVGQLELSGGTSYLGSMGDFVAACDGRGNLSLIGVADPTAPMIASYHRKRPQATFTRRPTAAGGLIYWPVGEYGFEILSVEVAPDLSVSRMENGAVQLRWEPLPGAKLQSTVDLASPRWEDVQGAEGTAEITIPSERRTSFFRVVKPL